MTRKGKPLKVQEETNTNYLLSYSGNHLCVYACLCVFMCIHISEYACICV